MNRYARQIILPEVGEEGQKRLSAAHALVIGAGGLGAPVIQYLAGAGVGRMTIVDDDLVDESNLHRQTLFRMEDLDQEKAEAAAMFARRLNPDVSVYPIVQGLGPDNAEMMVRGADVVLDCADSFAVSYTLSDVCLRLNKPLVSASALQMSGYAGAFCAAAPSLRAVFPDMPDNLQNCAAAGVLGPVVGAIGAVQAQMAVNILLGIDPSPLGQLVTYDARSFAFGGFRFNGAEEPDTAFPFIAPEAITENDFVAEMRPETEAPVPAVAHALRMNAADFTETGPRPANGERAVMCCRSGLRAWRAAENLSKHWDGEIVLVAFGND